ncbi:MAG: hypothetical protein IFNCLDLE_00425 [Ignavibacteriaceae bacterium]|nr:hypothetical protein [Ignavibacteriaceae bacterium]
MSSRMRVLVIQTAFPGDSVLALPFIQEVKKKFPDSEIDVLCAIGSAEIFKASPFVGSVYPFQKRGEHRKKRGMLKLATELRGREYDILYALHRSFRTAMMVNLIGAKESVGFDTASFSFLYDRTVKYQYKDHEVKRNLNMLVDYDGRGKLDGGGDYGSIGDQESGGGDYGSRGDQESGGGDYGSRGANCNNGGNYVNAGDYDGDKWKIKPILNATEEQVARVNEFFRANGEAGKPVIISPGSVWATKRYPVVQYAEVAKILSNSGYKIFVTGAENEKYLGEEIRRIAGDGVINTCGEFSIVETIELMRKCSLVITNDSAPTHFAMAADVPVLTIYCSTVPEFGFYGYLPHSRYISEKVYCKPCGLHGHRKCPTGTFECAHTITPEEIVKNALEAINDD